MHVFVKKVLMYLYSLLKVKKHVLRKYPEVLTDFHATKLNQVGH